MNRFVGRSRELKGLDSLYNSDRFEMAVIYGRRRVGKTSLIRKFIENKPAIYVQGVEATSELNLRYLSDAIKDFENPNRINKNAIFADYREAFSQVQDIANMRHEKIILVLDEYPYFAQADRSISSILQYVIDHVYKQFNNIMLILCGSSMSFMEHQVLGYKSPLYGRRTAQFKIRPFDIFDTRKMLDRVSISDLLGYYGITGGIPQYLSFIDQQKSVAENIKQLFLQENAPLQNEPNILMQEELRKPASYYSILTAIASGHTKSNDIAQSAGIKAAIGPYLNNLIELGIVVRKQSILEKSSRKYIYTFKDNMFRFWFRFVSDRQDQIAMGRVEGVLESIMQEFPRFLGSIFEQVCIQWLWQNKDLPFEPKEIKSWWGTNPVLKKQEEIDVVAINYDDSQAIVGECKWRNKDKLNHEMIDKLIQRSALLPKITQRYYYFFAKEVTSNFVDYASQRNVKVIPYSTFFE